jgi:simple sugar transport system substrate-binding protein/ribose transport system substrate-binding protein
VLLHANTGNNQAKEVELINTYAAQGVDGIAIQPLSETTSVEALKKLNAETGIPISLLNVDLKDSNNFVVGGVTTSHDALGRGSGKVAAEYIRDKLGGNAKLGVITFKSQYPEPAAQRMDGFVDEVKKVNPAVTVVAEAEAWVADMGIQAAGDMLTAHPDLDVIFACNDGGTIGTVMAVKNAGLAGKVVVYGIDGGIQQIQMLRSDDNILQAVTAQDAYGMGYKTMEILIKFIKGETKDDSKETTWLEGEVLSRADPVSVDAYEAKLKGQN